MGRRRSLLLFVYSRFNLSGLWYFLKWCFFTVVNFCGWLLGLVGLRRCATSYLKWFWCTAWCWRENKEASYRVIEDIGEDGSGRFVPTLDLADTDTVRAALRAGLRAAQLTVQSDAAISVEVSADRLEPALAGAA